MNIFQGEGNNQGLNFGEEVSGEIHVYMARRANVWVSDTKERRRRGVRAYGKSRKRRK